MATVPQAASFPPWRQDGTASLGRPHHEPVSDPDPFEFDIRRILGCASFRRLQYKTQVWIIHEGDHFRTRLTHTLEVAHLARRLARRLQLNVALAEAVALAHDLGHPPFGHAGERALNACMQGHGGFEHNAQSLRVIDYLEHPFPPFRGLNLSHEVREALAKHQTLYDHPAAVEAADGGVLTRLCERGPQPTLEGQVASLADRMAYDSHDLEDGIGAGLLSAEHLRGLQVWERAVRLSGCDPMSTALAAVRRPILDALQDCMLDDAHNATLAAIAAAKVQSPDDARRQPRPLVRFSDAFEGETRELETLLRGEVYGHPRLTAMDQRAERTIRELFTALLNNPSLLPERFAQRQTDQGTARVICDYIAGMTDRFCESEHRRATG